MSNIGLDIVKIERINKLKKNKKFIEKIFNEYEINYIEKKKYSSQTISGLFACKEAVSKALGTGIGKTKWKDIKILHDNMGKPYCLVNKKDKDIFFNISISHEKEYAVAVALENNNKYFIKEKLVPPFYLKKREAKSHKGTYGRVGVIGGRYGMSGSVYLTGTASLKMGSGLVYTLVPSSIADILSIKFDEIIVESIINSDDSFSNNSYENIAAKINKYDVLALGPGLGWDKGKIELVHKLIKNSNKKLVIDADGLNCVSEDISILNKKKNKMVLTPHIGEMARLTGKTKDYILDNSVQVSKVFAEKYNVILILKKNETIVASPEGQVYINKSGNPGMATAGSGDVLTGIITSLIGQGYDEFESSRLGVFIHGLAGDMASLKYGEYSMTAKDIIEFLPEASKQCTE